MSKQIFDRTFNEKYACDYILRKHWYGRDNLTVLDEKIAGYKKMDVEEQNTQILSKFKRVKEFLQCTDEELIDKIRNEEILLREYEFLLDNLKDWKILLLIKYDVINMIGKPDWTMEDIVKIFSDKGNQIKDRLFLYTGEDKKSKEAKAQDRTNKLYKRLYDSSGVTKDAIVNRIIEYLKKAEDEDVEMDYNLPVFFDDKPIVIYESELEAIRKANKKYRVNEANGRRIIRLLCMLLAWQKAHYHKFVCHRKRPYVYFSTEDLIAYNPILETEGRRDAVALIEDRKKLSQDGYIKKMLLENGLGREKHTSEGGGYFSLSFFVDSESAENEDVALEIVDYENMWEQIFVAAFKSFDVLEEIKEKNINQGEIREYDKNSKVGKVYIADKDKVYSFEGSGNYKVGNIVDVYIIDSKKGKIKILKKSNDKAYVVYKAVKRCSNCGKMFYAKQMGNGTGQCDVCNRR